MPNVGTDEHMQYVWEWARRQHAGRSCGSDPKRSRWWQFETASAAAIDFRYLDLLVLVWLGCRRKWWKTTDNPLLSISGLDLEKISMSRFIPLSFPMWKVVLYCPPINRDMVGEDVQEDAAEPLPGEPEASADAGAAGALPRHVMMFLVLLSSRVSHVVCCKYMINFRGEEDNANRVIREVCSESPGARDQALNL